METQIKIDIGPNGIELIGPFSPENNSVWRVLGGKFGGGRWIIPDTDPARAKIAELFGEASEIVTVNVTNKHFDRTYGSPVQVGGYVIASRRERDYAAQCAPGVVVSQGTLPRSGGSRKSPAVNAPDDVVFRVNVRRKFAEARGLEIATEIPQAERIAI